MSETDQILAVANKLFDGIERGDVSVLKEVYATDVGIWHNTDDLVQTMADNIATLEGFVQRIANRKYENRRLHAYPGGFVQQHRLTGTRKDGAQVTLDACIVCTVKDGKITRLDEYFDSAAVAKFRQAV